MRHVQQFLLKRFLIDDFFYSLIDKKLTKIVLSVPTFTLQSSGDGEQFADETPQVTVTEHTAPQSQPVISIIFLENMLSV